MADPFPGAIVIEGVDERVGGVAMRVNRRDTNGLILEAQGTTVPSAGAAGFGPGAIFIDTSSGRRSVNQGSSSSAAFYSVDSVAPVQYAEVSITAAEMKAIRATPKTLVAAPGAGKVLEFISATAIMDYVAAFTESSDDIVIRFTDGSGAIASTTLDTTNFLTATSDQIRTHKPIVTDITPVANSPLVLHNTGDGELAGTGSPVRYKVAYRIHATGL